MGIFLKSKKTEKVKNIRVEGYGGYFFEIEKILKKWKLYEWEDTRVSHCTVQLQYRDFRCTVTVPVNLNF